MDVFKGYTFDRLYKEIKDSSQGLRTVTIEESPFGPIIVVANVQSEQCDQCLPLVRGNLPAIRSSIYTIGALPVGKNHPQILMGIPTGVISQGAGMGDSQHIPVPYEDLSNDMVVHTSLAFEFGGYTTSRIMARSTRSIDSLRQKVSQTLLQLGFLPLTGHFEIPRENTPSSITEHWTKEGTQVSTSLAQTKQGTELNIQQVTRKE